MERFIIRYQDGAYDREGGWPVHLSAATVYESREAAEKAARTLTLCEVVAYPEDQGARPYTPAEWEAGIEGLTAPKDVLERLEATIRALAWARES